MRQSLLILSTIIVGNLFGQSKTLPYKNTLNTQSERNELSVVRTGSAGTYSWSVDVYASHDYPVGGSSTDTVSDWLFTPPIKVTSGAQLAFRYFVYGITGQATPVDEFSIWYGRGSKQPFNGSYVKLADLTYRISNQQVWRDTSGIQLPFVSDTGYICFRYKATNNWFTLGLDSIAVVIPGLGVKSSQIEQTNVYPNPSSGCFRVDCNSDIHQIEVFDLNMRPVGLYQADGTRSKDITLESVNPGYYIVKIITATGTLYRKITVE